MRAIEAPFAALLAGDQLDSVLLVELQRTSGTVYYALDPEQRTWNGKTFEPSSGFLSEVMESTKREVPSLRLILQNADGVLGPKLYPGITGGEDLRGRRVVVRRADRTQLGSAPAAGYVIEFTFFVESVTWISRADVALDLGVFPAEAIQVPDRSLQGLRCRWRYKGEHCGYVGTLPTCDFTFDGKNGCVAHFGADPKRFGAFYARGLDLRALRG